MALEETPHRSLAKAVAPAQQRKTDFRQGQVRCLGDQLQEPIVVRLDRMAAAIAPIFFGSTLPPIFFGSTLPLARHKVWRLLTELAATPKRSRTERSEPPASLASTMRRRRSIDSGLGMADYYDTRSANYSPSYRKIWESPQRQKPAQPGRGTL